MLASPIVTMTMVVLLDGPRRPVSTPALGTIVTSTATLAIDRGLREPHTFPVRPSPTVPGTVHDIGAPAGMGDMGVGVCNTRVFCLKSEMLSLISDFRLRKNIIQ